MLAHVRQFGLPPNHAECTGALQPATRMDEIADCELSCVGMLLLVVLQGICDLAGSKLGKLQTSLVAAARAQGGMLQDMRAEVRTMPWDSSMGSWAANRRAHMAACLCTPCMHAQQGLTVPFVASAVSAGVCTACSTCMLHYWALRLTA